MGFGAGAETSVKGEGGNHGRGWGAVVGGADGGMGTTLILGAWMMSRGAVRP